MPNWVYNNLTVSGDTLPLELFRQKIGKSYTATETVYPQGEASFQREVECAQLFSFWNIVKPAQDELEQYHNELAGSMPFWYRWNIENWGTKWDASNVELEESDGSLVYKFETAWSSPSGLLDSLSTQYPDLQFRLHYVEEQGWGGDVTIKDGVISESRNWDIPSSHAEYVDAGISCICEYYDEDEEVFSDCTRNV